MVIIHASAQGYLALRQLRVLSSSRDFMLCFLEGLILSWIVRGQVDDFAADVIISQLLLLDAEDPTKDIKLFINSPGGSVTAGILVSYVWLLWSGATTFIHNLCVGEVCVCVSCVHTHCLYPPPVCVHTHSAFIIGGSYSLQVSYFWVVLWRYGNLWCHQTMQGRHFDCLFWFSCIDGSLSVGFWHQGEAVLHAKLSCDDSSTSWRCKWFCKWVCFWVNDWKNYS